VQIFKEKRFAVMENNGMEEAMTIQEKLVPPQYLGSREVGN
jgi:hypothetical protein